MPIKYANQCQIVLKIHTLIQCLYQTVLSYFVRAYQKVQSSSYLFYKHHVTYKGLVGISSSVSIIFICQPQDGSISDKEIVARSGILDPLEIQYWRSNCSTSSIKKLAFEVRSSKQSCKQEKSSKDEIPFKSKKKNPVMINTKIEK